MSHTMKYIYGDHENMVNKNSNNIFICNNHVLRDEMLGIQISAEAFATEKSSSVGANDFVRRTTYPVVRNKQH